MEWWEAALLIVGGVFAGAINTVAGGGSMLTVPLLVLAGVPGNSANGSNRIGVMASNVSAAASFRRLGVDGLGHAIPVLVPVVAGSLVGSPRDQPTHRRHLRDRVRSPHDPADHPVDPKAEVP